MMGDTTSASTASASAPVAASASASTSAAAAASNITFPDFVSALNNNTTTGSIFPCLRSAATSPAPLAAAFQQHPDIAYQEFKRLWELSTDTANAHVRTLAALETARASLLAAQQCEHDCQDQISALSAENQALLADKAALHTAVQALSASPRPEHLANYRTAPQTDPDPYTGKDPSLLPKFIKDIAIKLTSNADLYPDDLSRM